MNFDLCYSYVRGVPLNNKASVHIAGCGDFQIKDVSFLPDPCPLPEQLKKRALVERERLIYAPFSGVGGIVYDKDAVYVELGGSHSHTKDDTGLMSRLLQTQATLDYKLEQSELQLFTNSEPIRSQDVEKVFEEEKVQDQSRIRRKVVFNDLEKFGDEILNDDNSDQDDVINENNMDVDEKVKDEEDEEEEEEDEEEDKEDEDEEDETENDTNTVDKGKKEKETTKSNKRKVTENISSKRLKLDQKSSKNGEVTHVYHELSLNQDHHIKNKISEALGLLGDHSSKFKSYIKENDGNSDESSEDESMIELAYGSEDTENEDNDENDKNVEEEEDDEDEYNQENLKWKKNIVERAREAFLDRQQSNVNLMRLVYGIFDKKVNDQEEEDPEKPEEEVGGIFKVVQAKQKQKIEERELKNQDDSVFYSKDPPRNWISDDNKALLINRFVTGKWKGSEDAETLLKLGKYTNLLLPYHFYKISFYLLV